MSNSLAKKRRANLSTPPPPPISTSINNSPSQGQMTQKPVTLPQLLSMFEKRLNSLEKNSSERPVVAAVAAAAAVVSGLDDSVKETLEEYESRFEILAEQITHIKDTLMKLQTYTMDVNKVLMEERFMRDSLVVVEEDGGEISFSEKAVFSELGAIVVEKEEENDAE